MPVLNFLDNTLAVDSPAGQDKGRLENRTGELGSGYAAMQSVSQICLVGDGPVVLALAELLTSDRVSYKFTARILVDLFPSESAFLGDLKKQYQALQQQEESSIKGGRHSRRVRAEAGVSDTPAAFLSGLEAALNGSVPVEPRRVLLRQDVLVQNLEEFENDNSRELTQSFVLACSATAYGAFLDRMHPYLSEGSTVILLGAPLFAAYEFKYQLAKRCPGMQVNVLEMDEPFSVAVVQQAEGGVARYQTTPCSRANVAGATLNETRRSLWLASQLCPEIIPASGLIERALLDAQSVLRPVFLLSALFGARVDYLSDVSRLLNRANLSLLVEIEQELSALAQAVHSQPVDFARSLREEVDVRSEAQGPVCDVTLAEAIVSIAGRWFAGHAGLWSYPLAQQYLALYVGDYLVPLAQLGQLLGVKTDALNSVITLAGAVNGVDYQTAGRRLPGFGLSRQSVLDMTMSHGLGY